MGSVGKTGLHRPARIAANPAGDDPGTTGLVAARQGPIKGRGAASHVPGRFEKTIVQAGDDGWGSVWQHAADDSDTHGDAPSHPRTQVREERARSVVSRNNSPDIGFSQSVNPYRGCEHGCVYCFARPSHAYLGLSPGLDFETLLSAKTNAAERLVAEFARPGYRASPIALGINTDAYQPIERRYRITRELLEVMDRCNHPVSLITKSALVTRDIDLLAPMAARNLATVFFSIATLDNRLAARMEPRAAAPQAKLRAMRTLSDAGIPVGVMVAPVVPMITDHEIEAILEAAREAGARSAGQVLLRLPHELKQVWREWLQLHYPDRAAHVMSLLQQMHGGKDYDASFGTRMRGTGPFADLIALRFAKAYKRFGYARMPPLDSSAFVAPRLPSAQGDLF